MPRLPLQRQFKPELPFSPGAEFSGVVREVGEGVKGINIGDSMLGSTAWGGYAQQACSVSQPPPFSGTCPALQLKRFPNGHGPATILHRIPCHGPDLDVFPSLRSLSLPFLQVSVPYQRLMPVPPGMSHPEASSLLMAYGTSYHALVDRGSLKAGDNLLILGASGGVGLAAVQIAKAVGAKVYAAASSPEKLALCKDEGAE